MPTRWQTVLPYRSGLGTDVSVNQWHLGGGVPSVGDAATIVTAFTTFYSDIEDYLSNIFSGDLRIKGYDMSEPEPRAVLVDLEIEDAFSGTTPTLPEEVALCVTTHAAPVSGVPVARRRGRFYLGPLSTAATTFNTTDGHEVDATATSFILNAAGALRATLAATGHPLCVYSRRDDAYRPIVVFSMDNAPDTIRSRGRGPTGRTFGGNA